MSTQSGSRRSGLVIETIYETVRMFQTNNKNNIAINYYMKWLITVSLTCLAVSACVSRSTQTAVPIDQFCATSAILTPIEVAVVHICGQMCATMNCFRS